MSVRVAMSKPTETMIWRGFTERTAHWQYYLGDFVFYKAHFFKRRGAHLVQTVIMFTDGDECMVQQAFFTRDQYDYMTKHMGIKSPCRQEHLSVSVEGKARKDFPASTINLT